MLGPFTVKGLSGTCRFITQHLGLSLHVDYRNVSVHQKEVLHLELELKKTFSLNIFSYLASLSLSGKKTLPERGKKNKNNPTSLVFVFLLGRLG